MSKSIKTVVISASALAVLGIILAVILIFFPEKKEENSSDENVPTVSVTNKNRENVEAVSVKNQFGSFLFTRVEKTEDSKTEFYWTCGELLGAEQDENVVNAFIGGLAALSRQPLVEENAENLEKYGLEDPLSEVTVTFDDDTVTKLYFGIANPSDTAFYFRTDNRNVLTVDKDNVSGVFKDIKDFVGLTLTESLSDTTVESVTINRKDLEETVEILYMSDILSDEDFVSATSNTHRFISPFTAEVDESGSAVYNNLCALTMSRCVYLEQSEENMEKCGLNDPFTVVEFTLGTDRKKLLIGDEIKREVSEGLTEVTGYYAVLEDKPGIFELSKDKAVWATFKPEQLISKRPLSPYIYYVEQIEITTADGTFMFDIDDEKKEFFYKGEKIDTDRFRSYYQQLIGSYGEEYYSGDISGSPIFSMKFIYAEKYEEKYGCKENLVEFYKEDERKDIAVIDGKPIFKVNAIYAERLSENVIRLINGEDIVNM